MAPSLSSYAKKQIFTVVLQISRANTSYHAEMLTNSPWFVATAFKYHEVAIKLSHYKLIISITVNISEQQRFVKQALGNFQLQILDKRDGTYVSVHKFLCEFTPSSTPTFLRSIAAMSSPVGKYWCTSVGED